MALLEAKPRDYCDYDLRRDVYCVWTMWRNVMDCISMGKTGLNFRDSMRIVINDAEEIQKGKRFRLVGFFGIASTSTHPDITKKVNDLDASLLEEFHKYPFVLAYCSGPWLHSKQYGNLVLLRGDTSDEALNDWVKQDLHQQAIDASPLYYHSIRIHQGRMAFANGGEPRYIQLFQTRYIRFHASKVLANTLHKYQAQSLPFHHHPHMPCSLLHYFPEPASKHLRFVCSLGHNHNTMYEKITACLDRFFSTASAGLHDAEIPLAVRCEYLCKDGPINNGTEAIIQDEADCAFSCGMIIAKAIGEGHPLLTCVAPVMPHPRYCGKPVYFCDVIVRADSSSVSLEDLKGKKFAYNEEASLSGFLGLAAALHAMKQDWSFFCSCTRVHAHASSIQHVLDGAVDCASIDSILLEAEMEKKPGLKDRLRVVKSIGPFPAPPLVISGLLPRAHSLRAAMVEVLVRDPFLNGVRENLKGNGVACFAEVQNKDYAVLLECAAAADRIRNSLPVSARL